MALRKEDGLCSVENIKVVKLARHKYGLLMITRHLLGQLALDRDIRGFEVLIEHRLSIGCLVGAHQKVFRLHIHAFIHDGVTGEKSRFHHLNLAHWGHRVGVHEC